MVIEQLTDCWNYFRDKDELVRGAPLYVETVEAVTFCTACEKNVRNSQVRQDLPALRQPGNVFAAGK